MDRIIQWLTYLGWLFGGIVILYGLQRFLTERIVPALLVSMAVVIAGPLEDFLKNRVRRGQRSPEQPAVTLVDRATSLAFLLLLVVAISRM
ncbi:MAG: hypothetical protein ACT4P5_15785 [Armatimonadota bacterium]